MDKIRLVVADDHPIFLEGICTLVSMKYPELEIVGQASNGREAAEIVSRTKPDVVLLDIRMPVLNGLDAAALIRKENKDIKIIILTTFNEESLISDALTVGINGYILKERPILEVIENLKSVVNGNLLLSQKVADHLVKNVRYNPPLPKKKFQFTKREEEIFWLMISHHSNQLIAEKLHISERTVRNYVSRIYEMVGVHNRESFRLWAIDQDLIST